MPGINGPAPKKPDQRRRRNKPAAGDWIQLPIDGRKGPAPTLPKDLELSTTTHKWWKEIWRSPMATQWTDADVPALIELAILRNRFMVGSLQFANEVRLRSDQFGLTPEGRQKRRWIITDEDALRAGLEIEDELAQKRVERDKRVAAQRAARARRTRTRKPPAKK